MLSGLKRAERWIMEIVVAGGQEELRPGSWGGDARGLDKLGDKLRVGYDAAQESRAARINQAEIIATRLAALKERAEAGDAVAANKLATYARLQAEAAEADAMRPKPKLNEAQKRVTSGDENTQGDIIAGMAEESARNLSIAKMQPVSVDPGTAARIAGAGSTGESAVARANVTIDQSPEAQPIIAPQPQEPPVSAPPSALAKKMQPNKSGELGLAIDGLTKIRLAIEAGDLAALALVGEIQEKAAELLYAIAGQLRRGPRI